MTSAIRKAYLTMLTALGASAGIVIGLMALLISLDIIMRNLGGPNLPWLLDTTEYALFVSTFIAAPWALRTAAHVRVDLVLRALPAGTARGLEMVADGTGTVICLILAYYGASATWTSYSLNSMVFKYLIFPEWWMLWIIPASAILLALEFVFRAIRIARHQENVTADLHFDVEGA